MTPEFGPDRRVASVLCVGRDISTIKENEFRLQQAETMARIGHWHWDFAQGKSLVSAGLCHIFGRPANWRPSLTEAFDMIVTEDRDQVRSAFRAAFSRLDVEIDCGYRVNLESGVLYLHSRVCIEYAPDGRPFRLIGTAQDISELKSYESRLHEMAFHDILTGLPNRAQLNDRLSQALTDAKRHNQRLGLLVLDLDRFKEINDTHGHGMGDQVLNTVAERLRGLVRDYDTVARLGGDEFAIIFPEIREAANLGGISQKILDALARPIHLGKNNLFISASIGIAVFPSDGKTADELLQYADSALFDAKDHGRASFRFYLAELTAKSRERSMLEADLRRAEANGELELYYQPKVDLTDGSLIGAEALVRWNHPTLGLLAPDKFIGIAEDTGLIVSIGAWILSEACRTVRRWNRHNDRALKMAVNFSPRQFHGDDLVTTVCNTLAATRCEPGWLEVEITESLLLDDHSGVRATLDSFRVQGISIAIDDFGTGYSALGYLKRFPIDVLKIDRSFTSEVMQDHHSAELVKVIILMAHGMGLDVVAEGVETSEQANFLNNHGCHLGQGYLFGKPMPLEVFETHPCFVENA